MEIGTVVRACIPNTTIPRKLTRIFSKQAGGTNPWVDEILGHQWRWSELGNPSVLHTGYVPNTPEPTKWSAVVRDADGFEWRREGAGDEGEKVWKARSVMWNHSYAWSALPQPVEVLFEGVEE